MEAMSKKRWSKFEIREAFEEYVRMVKLVETDDWAKLSVDDIDHLTRRHFKIFSRELERWRTKK